MQFIAHRGLHNVVTENTLEAFQRAVDAGFHGVELDAHVTADGICVVHHDETVGPTLGSQQSIAIAKSSYDSIVKAKPSIPRLSDVLDLLTDKLHVYVELKGNAIERDVAKVIKSSRAECSVHSFDHHAVARFKLLMPAVRTGILQSSRLVDSVHALKAANALDLWQWYEFVDERLVHEITAMGGQVICWTANDPLKWASFQQDGVAAVCTDLSPVAM